MPIYRYQAINKATACIHCAGGFERLQKIHDAPLTHCPHCGSNVHKIIAAANVVSGTTHHSDPKHLEKHGFTQYRKVGKGIYEKTAGKGPDYISGD